MPSGVSDTTGCLKASVPQFVDRTVSHSSVSSWPVMLSSGRRSVALLVSRASSRVFLRRFRLLTRLACDLVAFSETAIEGCTLPFSRRLACRFMAVRTKSWAEPDQEQSEIVEQSGGSPFQLEIVADL